MKKFAQLRKDAQRVRVAIVEDLAGSAQTAL